MFRTNNEEERVFQFDEEMLKKREAQTPIYHIGRGGAANFVDESRDKARMERVNSTASVLSSSSEGSGTENTKREGTFAKLARRFS